MRPGNRPIGLDIGADIDLRSCHASIILSGESDPRGGKADAEDDREKNVPR
ncbi:hypothetical protein GCM10010172_49820 [Paractinoplanes ferrugineus]|uniref:Uncharacterized protein n=1 Tax=Paractinoplanes ferrugineus TaxID=113564 RepID=A0A919JEL1_9ACTN|nr:hypothetical protein Afe05nite_75960 [Actinoplanes ferrugineus]